MVGLNDVMQYDVVLESGYDFANVSNQPTVDCEQSIWERRLQELNPLKDQPKRVVDRLTRHITARLMIKPKLHRIHQTLRQTRSHHFETASFANSISSAGSSMYSGDSGLDS